MKSTLLLTWRYLCFNRLKSLILLVCLTITLYLPFALHYLIQAYNQNLTSRARTTPLVVGTKGDRFDLVLKSLYFTGDSPGTLNAADLDGITEQGRGTPIPLHIEFTARETPIVGTSPDYYRFRRIRAAEGTLPLLLGDAALGANVAKKLKLSTEDRLLTDQKSLYNIAAVYPLKMRITGVLAPTGTADDDAVFVDTKTAWIVAGIGHGHTDLTQPENSALLLGKTEGEVQANAAVIQYTEITEENIDSFHFHSERDQLPLTSILVLPNSEKSATLLKGRFSVSETRQMLEPTEVVDELMNIVFQIKRFFDGTFALVLFATTLFLGLIALLSLRIRERERQTLFRIGCSRATVLWLQATELLLLLAASLILAFVCTWITVQIAPNLLGS